MTFRKLKKRWLKAQTNEKRYILVGEFMHLVIQQIADGSVDMITVYKQSAEFIDRPILSQQEPNIDWCLDRDFFLQIMCQVLKDMPDLPIVGMFKMYGWDYERALNPQSSDISTIEVFTVDDVIQGAQQVRLLLVSKTKYPIGSVVINNRSLLEYEVAEHVGNRYTLIGDNIVLERYEHDITLNFHKAAK